jgi:hypothetical protein
MTRSGLEPHWGEKEVIAIYIEIHKNSLITKALQIVKIAGICNYHQTLKR